MAIADLLMLDASLYQFDVERLALAILVINLTIYVGKPGKVSLDTLKEALRKNVYFEGLVHDYL